MEQETLAQREKKKKLLAYIHAHNIQSKKEKNYENRTHKQQTHGYKQREIEKLETGRSIY